jgi:hypothetical protein
LLENSETREVFKTIRDETSSLYVQRDSTSLYSLGTDNLSNVSVEFQFDRELFVSKVYERTLRGSLKEALIQQKKRIKIRPPNKEKLQNKLSHMMDALLEADARDRMRFRILLLGSPESGKKELVKKLMLMNPYHYTDEEISSLRLQITIIALHVMRETLHVAIQSMNEMEIDIKPYVYQLSGALREIDEFDTSHATSTAVEAVTTLWGNSQFAGIIVHGPSKDRLPEATP